jgi:hypothetical protein
MRSEMRDAAAPAEPESPASVPDAPDPLLDRQLQMLGDLAEIGLEIARALESQAKRTGPVVAEGDIALAYGRVARAVRQAILLQSRLVEDFKARAAAADRTLADARSAAEEALAEREHIRKCRIGSIVERVAEASHDDEEEIDRLVREADERLDDEGLWVTCSRARSARPSLGSARTWASTRTGPASSRKPGRRGRWPAGRWVGRWRTSLLRVLPRLQGLYDRLRRPEGPEGVFRLHWR